jgi:uncharacterized protein
MQTTPFDTESEARSFVTPPPIAKGTRSRRSAFLKWLRKIHGWVGLWGALAGLLFGVTGFLQNHREVMGINIGRPVVSTVELALPSPAPKSPRELAAYLQNELKLDRPPERVTREKATPVEWGDQSVMQPEHWTVRFIAPSYLITAQFWKGNDMVSIERRDHGLLNTLEGLHRSEGAKAGWILLADSFAGSPDPAVADGCAALDGTQSPQDDRRDDLYRVDRHRAGARVAIDLAGILNTAAQRRL